jgi:3-methyladenine DNA glycosylase AlkC
MAAALKDSVDASVVAELADRFGAVDAGFDVDGFTARAVAPLADLELKGRVEHIARTLWHTTSAEDGAARMAVLVDVARAEPPVEGWAAWPLAAVVELFGLDHLPEALAALEPVTKRMSCEFAVRPLLRQHFEPTYARLVELTEHDDDRVRRLPSEGTRPLLPWAPRVPQLLADPMPGLALLERLRHDESETVRRSVANHLNDVSRAHPGLVVETTARWLDEPETDRRMIAHGLRTLVKAGDPAALAVLGFSTDPQVEVERFEVGPAIVEMGDHLALAADLRSTGDAPQRLVIDFVVHHVNASGETSPKVFKWTTADLAPGERRTFAKRRLIRQASTRTYRSGTHRVELQVGGTVVASGAFDVRT